MKKNWKSKNGVKTALTPLFKELWAIYVFFTNLKFDDYQKHQRKPAKVQKSWRIEFQPRKGSKMWKILRSISGAEIRLKKWWSQKTSPRGLNWGKFKKKNYRKKGILGPKIWKKLKVQKWCQNGSNSII